MTEKLSLQKVSRMLPLYLSGHTQTAIASKLKVGQGTMSAYIAQSKSLVEQHGAKAAAQPFGTGDQVDELHSLVVEKITTSPSLRRKLVCMPTPPCGSWESGPTTTKT